MAVLRLIGLASGEPTPFDGQYVVAYDPSRDGDDPLGQWMNCRLVTTPDPERALHRPTSELMALYRKVDPRAPKRADGYPNRPLTAFSAEIVSVMGPRADSS